MSVQQQVQLLERFLKDVDTNVSEIVRIYQSLSTKKEDPEMASVIPLLNQSSDKILNPEVLTLMKKHRLDAFRFTLVANNLIDLEDLKDDLLNGDVLEHAAPANAIRKLKADLGLALSNQQSAAMSASAASQSHIAQNQGNKADSHEDVRRLAVEIKNQCKVMKQGNNVLVYQLPLTIAATFPEAPTILRRFSFGKPCPKNTTSKTILLSGATGSGKTTIINAMINYILGVEWNDPFRFILIDEEVQGGSQAFSQTRGVTAYDIHYQDGFRIPYSLTIVDTPGFGDTEGIERDLEITSSIKKFFEHLNGIQVLDAVGFVVQSSLARLTTAQTYIFNSVLSIFGQDVGENVLFLTTFSDGRQPIVLSAIKEAKLPCKLNQQGLPCYQSFNNGSIYVSNRNEEDRLSPIEWESGMKNFRLFFNELSKMTVKSLQLTKEVLNSRECLEITVKGIESKIKFRLAKMEELRAIQSEIEKHEAEVNANMNFEIEVPVNKKVRVNVDELTAMNCSECQQTCHYPCNPAYPISWCNAFRKASNVRILLGTVLGETMDFRCRVCPEKCLSSQHKNEDTKWGYIQASEKQTLYNIRKKYEDASEKKSSADDWKEALLKEIEKVKDDMLQDIRVITQHINKLKKIALRGDPLSAPAYIKLMIAAEKKETKPGFLNRIQYLEEIERTAWLTQAIAGGEDLEEILGYD